MVTSTILSNLPGLSNALSTISIRLVAPIVTTLRKSSRPSNSVSSRDTTRSVTLESPKSPRRRGAIASISSKKITDGCLSGFPKYL